MKPFLLAVALLGLGRLALADTLLDPRPAPQPFFDDFGALDATRWHRNGPWFNGDIFGAGWKTENARLEDDRLKLRIDATPFDDKTPYSAGEVGSQALYGFGRFEARLKPIHAPGVITSFFTFTNKPVHDEIDIEFTGNNTRGLSMTYYTAGKAISMGRCELPFDAAEAFHSYAFEWRPDSIVWLVDGKEVARATPKNGPICRFPGGIMMNAWPTKGADKWAGPFQKPDAPLEAVYEWVRWTPMSELGRVK